MNFDSFTGIYQKREYKGKAIPAFIGKKIYREIKVFEDGIIDCENIVDYESFKEQLIKEYVTCYIPDGEYFDVHHLGIWTISEGKWLFNHETFYEHIKDVIKGLNPNWTEKDKHVGMTQNVPILEMGIFGEVWFDKNMNESKGLYISKDYHDCSFHMFYKIKDYEYYLVSINVILKSTIIGSHESSILITGIEFPESISNDDFDKLVKEEVLASEIPINSIVKIYGLGEFKITECKYAIETTQKVLEIKDAILAINNKPTSREQFYEKYKEFIYNPSEKRREELRTYFEKIPSHLTRYLGDMDSKDNLIRGIIYGTDDLEKLIEIQKEIGL